ncbi:hypothetical protein DFS34DRAFT_616903 [Phlyctochytrium arcticum]|nr:hypothetical protein DFS34DRAFT_616903 [Phlyctochytrium arcticum]
MTRTRGAVIARKSALSSKSANLTLLWVFRASSFIVGKGQTKGQMSDHSPSQGELFQESLIGFTVTGHRDPQGPRGTLNLDHTETEDFVRYLLEGSGAENDVDFAALRRDLEFSTPSISRVLDLQSYNTSTSTPSEASKTPQPQRPLIQPLLSHDLRDGNHRRPSSEAGSSNGNRSERQRQRPWPERETIHHEDSTTDRRERKSPRDQSETRPTNGNKLETQQRRAWPEREDIRHEHNPTERGDRKSPRDHSETRPREDDAAISSNERTRSAPLNFDSLRSVTSSNYTEGTRATYPTRRQPAEAGLPKESTRKADRAEGGDPPSRRSGAGSHQQSRANSPVAAHSGQTHQYSHDRRGPSPAPGSSDQSAKLRNISDKLTGQGFQPLHPSLLYSAVAENASIGSLTDRQCDALNSTLSSILTEYARRGDTIQSLVANLAEVERERNEWRDKAERASVLRERDMGHDSKTIEELQKTIKASVVQNSTLTSELVSAREECSKLRNRNDDLQRRLREQEDASERLKMEIADMVQKAEQKRLRTERSFATITNQFHRSPNKSGIDRLTLDVIEAYERRLAKAQTDVERLRTDLKHASRQSSRQHSRHPSGPTDEESARQHSGPSTPKLQRHGKDDDGDDAPFEAELDVDPSRQGRSAIEISLESEKLEQLQRAMGQQINGLQARLEAMTQALRESQKEADLLKLQLLATKKGDWSEQSRRDRANGVKTRDLIRMDKKAFKLKLFKIDNLSHVECQEMLKDVCIKLDVEDIDKLGRAVDAAEQLKRQVPQIENFVQGVYEVVWNESPQVHGDTTTTILTNSKILQRLSDTIRVIGEWAESLRELDTLQKFRRGIHDLVGVRVGPDSGDRCVDEIRRLRSSAQKHQMLSSQAMASDSSRQALNHFRDLFELGPNADVQGKMNDLYVFSAEVQSGLTRLRDVLGLEKNIQPGRVLIHAAEAVLSLSELSDAMRKSIRRSSLDQLRRPASPRVTQPDERAQDDDYREYLNTSLDRISVDDIRTQSSLRNHHPTSTSQDVQRREPDWAARSTSQNRSDFRGRASTPGSQRGPSDKQQQPPSRSQSYRYPSSGLTGIELLSGVIQNFEDEDVSNVLNASVDQTMDPTLGDRDMNHSDFSRIDSRHVVPQPTAPSSQQDEFAGSTMTASTILTQHTTGQTGSRTIDQFQEAQVRTFRPSVRGEGVESSSQQYSHRSTFSRRDGGGSSVERGTNQSVPPTHRPLNNYQNRPSSQSPQRNSRQGSPTSQGGTRSKQQLPPSLPSVGNGEPMMFIDPDELFGGRGSETVLMEGGTVEGVNLSFGDMDVDARLDDGEPFGDL